jgi:hypothetical protein
MDRVEITDIQLRKPIICPWCRVEHDMALSVTGSEKPEPGDVFLCIKCGKFALWFGASQIRKPTWEEFQEALAMPEVVMAWLAWKGMMLEQRRDKRRG